MSEPKVASIRKEILAMADHCINGDRDKQYGNPEDNFNAIAEYWTNYIHTKYPKWGWQLELKGEDVGLMMALFKIARASTGEFKMDNYVDLVGYAACAGECADEKNSRERCVVPRFEGGEE